MVLKMPDLDKNNFVCNTCNSKDCASCGLRRRIEEGIEFVRDG